MDYDVFTKDRQLAEEVVEVIGEVYSVDTTDRTEVYQFFDIDVFLLSKIRNIIEDHPEYFEVRVSKNGKFIWPSRQGFALDQALDVI